VAWSIGYTALLVVVLLTGNLKWSGHALQAMFLLHWTSLFLGAVVAAFSVRPRHWLVSGVFVVVGSASLVVWADVHGGGNLFLAAMIWVLICCLTPILKLVGPMSSREAAVVVVAGSVLTFVEICCVNRPLFNVPVKWILAAIMLTALWPLKMRYVN